MSAKTLECKNLSGKGIRQFSWLISMGIVEYVDHDAILGEFAGGWISEIWFNNLHEMKLKVQIKSDALGTENVESLKYIFKSFGWAGIFAAAQKDDIEPPEHLQCKQYKKACLHFKMHKELQEEEEKVKRRGFRIVSP